MVESPWVKPRTSVDITNTVTRILKPPTVTLLHTCLLLELDIDVVRGLTLTIPGSVN